MMEQTPDLTLPTVVVEPEPVFRADSHQRGEEAPRIATRYAGHAFAWHFMSAAERRAFIARVRAYRTRGGKPTQRAYTRRNYCYE